MYELDSDRNSSLLPDTNRVESEADEAFLFATLLHLEREIELNKHDRNVSADYIPCARDAHQMRVAWVPWLQAKYSSRVLHQGSRRTFPPDRGDTNLRMFSSEHAVAIVTYTYLWLMHVLLRQPHRVHWFQLVALIPHVRDIRTHGLGTSPRLQCDRGQFAKC